MSNVRTITVQAGQTLADIALQEYGTVEGMVLLLQANTGLSVGADLTPGTELLIPADTLVKTPGAVTQAAPEPEPAAKQITVYDAPVKTGKTYNAVKTITVQAGQTLADIAMQEYGTFEGAILLLQSNPGLSVAEELAAGQQLTVFTNYTVNLVKELVKVEPFASQLQNVLAQWVTLVKPQLAETDPVFTAWLASYVPFSGSYNDLANKPTIPTTYLSLTDAPHSRAGKAKHVVGVNDAETADEYIHTKIAQLTDNSDFPATHVGQALKILREKADESGLEFYTLPYSFPASDVYAWAKAATKPGYSWSEITGKPTQEIELNQEWKLGNNLYIENVFTGSDLTQINYWSSAAKTLKLFTKDITYTGGNITSIVLKDEITGKLLTTTITYLGSDVSNVTKVVS